jgi:hypothetical protein
MTRAWMRRPTVIDFLAREFRTLLGKVAAGVRVVPLIRQFGVAQLLADYDSACPDRVRSLNNFIALSSYADKIHPSANLIVRWRT